MGALTKKLLSSLVDFGQYGWWGLSESGEKGKFVTKIFFQIILNEVLRSYKNDIY